MDTGYKLQRIGDQRGPFVADLDEAMRRLRTHLQDVDNPFNLREGHTWVWGPDRQRDDAFARVRELLNNRNPGYGVVLRGHANDGGLARHRQWAIWKIVQLEGKAVIQHGIDLMGLRYVFGGASETGGLDCSGLTQVCYQTETGLLLPHSADLQYQDDRVDLFHDVNKARPGDLVFMHFGRLAVGHADHVGLFMSVRDGVPFMLDTRSTTEPVAIRQIEMPNVMAFGRVPEVNGQL